MSVAQTVFLSRTKLPTREGWARALKEHGFRLELDESFDPSNHQGYLPCAYAGEKAGFECLISTTKDHLVEQDLRSLGKKLRGRDTAVSFVTRSSLADLKAATIAASVLAAISDGLLWSDEAGEFVDEPLAHARDTEAEVELPPPPPPTEPRSIEAELATRIVFRGRALTTLESIESTPRRFTVKVAVGNVDARILALWEHPVGAPTVHRLRIGDTIHELDPKGTPSISRPIAELVAELGITEAATRELLAAGTSAVPSLCHVVSDTSRPTTVRRIAIVILGQLHDRSAQRSLEALIDDAELGDAAREALERL
jgi:hypothetical protein